MVKEYEVTLWETGTPKLDMKQKGPGGSSRMIKIQRGNGCGGGQDCVDAYA